jgi:hexosaminidase
MNLKSLPIPAVLAVASLVLAGCSPEPAKAPAAAKGAGPTPLVIPVPRDFTRQEGSFSISAATEVVYSGDGAAPAANYLVEQLKLHPQVSLGAVQPGEPESGAVAFVLAPDDASFEAEGYSLVITPKGVTIRSRTPAGSFYGAVTLWQLLTLRPPQGGVVELPVLEIRDAPRFAWRGLMLDSARHYQSPEFIKQFIDWMAQHKLNVLHWHLTDDQAWRLEIKKYPKLTSVGGWRVPAGAAARADIDPRTGKPRLHGGIYTQEQAREIVAYAAARHIRVVPEIEMPGHASAAIVAYPELAVPPNRLAAVPSDWGVYENLFNVEESTFAFLEDVLTEVMAVFPGEYIHVGGDEAVKPQWEKSPRVQARMKELGVKDAHALQGYFIQRIEKFISGKGRRLIGWDEIIEGGNDAGLGPTAAVMSWRGVDGAIAAAKSGRDAVLSPAPILYFDHWQSAGDLAPGRSDTVSLEMVYQFQPVPASIPEEQRKHILGMQANLWAEMMRTEDRVVYMTFPRVAALAEVAWSPKERIVWTDFQRRLEWQLRRYDKQGIRYAREVQLNPLPRRRLSHDLEPCGSGYLLSLEDDAPLQGERAVFLVNITNPCWIWRGADLTEIGELRATVGQIPFNFQIGETVKKIPLYKPRGDGELEIRLDNCESEPVARASLSPAMTGHGLTVLPPVSMGAISGTHDLCFRFTRASVDPIWVIGSVELTGK